MDYLTHQPVILFLTFYVDDFWHLCRLELMVCRLGGRDSLVNITASVTANTGATNEKKTVVAFLLLYYPSKKKVEYWGTATE